MRNLVFYEYTFRKMFKSISTYITGAIAIAVPLIVAILALSKGTSNESTLAMTTYFTFPVMIIFLAFKISQIFRDEIENKTLLTIQAKPITRKQMVFQGLLATWTFVLIITFVGGFIPFVLESFNGGSRMLAHGALIMITEILLLVIISVIGLWLSLSMGGKAFIGLMIGGFVAGFYVLFGVTAFINFSGTRAIKASTSISSLEKVNVSKTETYTLEDGSTGPITDEFKAIYTVTIAPNSTTSKQDWEQSDKFIGQLIDNKKATFATVSAWFNPVVHWTKMFSSTENYKVDALSGGRTIDIWQIFNSDAYIKVWDVVKDKDGHITSFKYQQIKKDMIPTWYPYLIWIAIAGISIPFVIRSITRKNIA